MERRIVGFRQDQEGHWIADMECGHSRHMRHEPPWSYRPWVLTEAGRSDKLGQMLGCAACAALSAPV